MPKIIFLFYYYCFSQ